MEFIWSLHLDCCCNLFVLHVYKCLLNTSHNFDFCAAFYCNMSSATLYKKTWKTVEFIQECISDVKTNGEDVPYDLYACENFKLIVDIMLTWLKLSLSSIKNHYTSCD